ncbi:MAG: RluA family pseudouridine synthase [Acidobacteria bacterium]|nr:RluA family pseudouridine synthase [Acidobacteriota bacterium]
MKHVARASAGGRYYTGVETPPRQRSLVYRVTERDAGVRLDLFLKERIPKMSREGLKRAIVDRVVVRGRPRARASTALRAGDEVEMTYPPPEASRAVADGAAAPRILHDDAAILVADKPAGMLSHATSRSTSLSLLGWLRGAGFGELHLVHRLDRETSGLTVLARTAEAARALSRDFARRAVEKRYLAIVFGEVAAEEGVIDRPIGSARGSAVHVKQGVDEENGRPARTRIRVLERLRGFTFLELHPETGRRHQIRVHLMSIGHPVAGDVLYGARESREAGITGRQLLHAGGIRFRHPASGDAVSFDSPIPPDMEAFLVSRRRPGA